MGKQTISRRGGKEGEILANFDNFLYGGREGRGGRL